MRPCHAPHTAAILIATAIANATGAGHCVTERDASHPHPHPHRAWWVVVVVIVVVMVVMVTGRTYVALEGTLENQLLSHIVQRDTLVGRKHASEEMVEEGRVVGGGLAGLRKCRRSRARSTLILEIYSGGKNLWAQR